MSAQTVDSFPLMGAEATVLAGGDTTGDAWEALQLDLAPGARSPRHTLSADKLFAVVAGTVTTLTAGILGLDSYQRERIHGAQVTVAEVEAQADALVQMDRAARAALPYMHPGRVDVIAAGGLIFARVVARVDEAVRDAGSDLTIVVSETDILDGIALDLAS